MLDLPDPTDLERSTFRALIVDDDRDFRELLTKQLQRMGCCVDVSENAGQFLALLTAARSAYDIAVIDVKLPGLNGDHVVSWIRDSELFALNSLPILFVTGFSDGLREQFDADGNNIGVLAKPYRYDQLKIEVSRLLCRDAHH